MLTKRARWGLGIAIVAAAAAVVAIFVTRDAGDGARSFRRSQRRLLAMEAKVQLRTIATATIAYYEEERGGPDGGLRTQVLPGSAGPTPPASACDYPARTFPAGAGRWDQDPVWRAIGFSIAGKHRYSYSLRSTESGFTATAHGDLDCDGLRSTFELQGTIGSDRQLDKRMIRWSLPEE